MENTTVIILFMTVVWLFPVSSVTIIRVCCGVNKIVENQEFRK